MNTNTPATDLQNRVFALVRRRAWLRLESASCNENERSKIDAEAEALTEEIRLLRLKVTTGEKFISP